MSWLWVASRLGHAWQNISVCNCNEWIMFQWQGSYKTGCRECTISSFVHYHRNSSKMCTAQSFCVQVFQLPLSSRLSSVNGYGSNKFFLLRMCLLVNYCVVPVAYLCICLTSVVRIWYDFLLLTFRIFALWTSAVYSVRYC